MIRLINYDVMMYMLMQAIKDLRREGNREYAALVEEIAHHMQDNLDEMIVTKCPLCGERLDGEEDDDED